MATLLEPGAGITHAQQARWILLIMTFGCFFILSSQRINMSIGIIGMVNWTTIENHTSNHCVYIENEDGEFSWRPTLQAQVHVSYFYGLVLMQLPAELLVEKFSPQIIALIGMTLSAVCCILTPLCAEWHIAGLMVVQTMKAIGHAAVLPAFSVMMGKWIPTKRLVTFMAYGTSGIPVGAFLTVILGGIICSSKDYGWTFLFYSSGAVGLIWCILWLYLCRDISFMPVLTTSRRLARNTFPKRDLYIPFTRIMTSKPFWGYTASGIASYWMIALNLFVMPSYFKIVFGLSLQWNGLVSSFPNILQAFVYLFSFALLSRKTSNKTAVRRFVACSGMSIFATCVVLMSFVRCKQTVGILLLVIGVGASGFNLAALSLMPLDMAPRFAGILAGIMNTVGAIAGCGLPVMVGSFTEREHDVRNWEKVFYACAFVTFISMILFMAYSSSEIQPWNKVEEKSNMESHMILESHTSTSWSRSCCRGDNESPKHQEATGDDDKQATGEETTQATAKKSSSTSTSTKTNKTSAEDNAEC